MHELLMLCQQQLVHRCMQVQYDLLIGADGVGSTVRSQMEHQLPDMKGFSLASVDNTPFLPFHRVSVSILACVCVCVCVTSSGSSSCCSFWHC